MRRLAERALLLAVSAVLAASCFSGGEEGELSVFGPYVGREADIFGEVLKRFEAETGISTSYVGSASFQSDFADRATSADFPDVVVLPQPALLERLISRSNAEPMDAEGSRTVLETVGGEWEAFISRDSVVFAVPYRFVVKSLVWYRADEFADRGYQVPETLDELQALVGRMIEDGSTPWCAGMDDGLSTGWWATDWVEDLVIRRAGPGTYYSWSYLTTPFDDPAIVDAMAEFQSIIGRPGAVHGGRRALLNTQVAAAMAPMFEPDPACLMHKQASFQAVWLPAGEAPGNGRLDLFPLPSADGGPPPLMLGGEFVVATSDNPSAQDLLLYLLGDEAFDPWREVGGSLVPRVEFDLARLEDPLDIRLAALVEEAEVVVYDASDLMPPSVGTGTFFTGMIELVSGAAPDEVAGRISDSVVEIGRG